jgi:hypothetical protein
MENKTKFTVTEAEKLTGFSRQTISTYIKQGKLSAEIGPNGKKLIDLSELHRVFGNDLTPGSVKPNGKLPRQDAADLTPILRSEIERLVREVNVMREERDAERRLREREIEKAADERAKLEDIIANQTRMLAAPKPEPEPKAEPEPTPAPKPEKKSFWKRWTFIILL